MLAITTTVCALATLALVAAEWRGARQLRTIAKITASTAFVATGVLAANGRSDGYACALIVGLVLGAIGDVCLLGDSQGAFLAGLGTFLLGHLAYVVALAQVSAPSAWFGLAGPAAALPIAIGAIAMALLWRRLGSMRVPVILYVVAIITMVIGALATHSTIIITGAALFFASDLSVARDKFVGRALANKVWGLPAYFAGQLLLAWSLAGR